MEYTCTGIYQISITFHPQMYRRLMMQFLHNIFTQNKNVTKDPVSLDFILLHNYHLCVYSINQ